MSARNFKQTQQLHTKHTVNSKRNQLQAQNRHHGLLVHLIEHIARMRSQRSVESKASQTTGIYQKVLTEDAMVASRAAGHFQSVKPTGPMASKDASCDAVLTAPPLPPFRSPTLRDNLTTTNLIALKIETFTQHALLSSLQVQCTTLADLTWPPHITNIKLPQRIRHGKTCPSDSGCANQANSQGCRQGPAREHVVTRASKRTCLHYAR